MPHTCKYCLNIDLADVVRTDPAFHFGWLFEMENTDWIPKYYENPDVLVRHHGSLRELVDCALDDPGCDTCRAFLGQYAQSIPSDNVEHWKGAILKQWKKALEPYGKTAYKSPLGVTRYLPAKDTRFEWDLADKPLGISLTVMREDEAAKGKWSFVAHTLTLYLLASPDAYPEDIRKSVWLRQVAPDASSPTCLGRAVSWLQDCLQNHETCLQYKTSSWMPTRLIDLSQTLPRLVDSKDGLPNGNYVALSYCWGPGKKVKLLKELELLFRTGIPWDIIPETLVCAMRVTQALGISYLWIDALCIIQNDVQEWRKESLLMNDVYRHATVTIVAASGASCDEDLFAPRTIPTEFLWHKALEPGLAPCRLVAPPKPLDHAHTYGDGPPPAWETRGWTIQEHFSSRRVLTFLPGDVTWDCLTLHQRESGFCQAQHDNERAVLSRKQWYGWQEAVNQMATSSQADIIMHFYRFASGLGNRTFTCYDDRLPAASGIAKLISRHLSGRDTYIAGLWVSQLARGLVWNVYENIVAPPRRDQAAKVVPPMWSWAAAAKGKRYSIISGHVSSAEALIQRVELPTASESERFIPTEPLPLTFDVPTVMLGQSPQATLDKNATLATVMHVLGGGMSGGVLPHHDGDEGKYTDKKDDGIALLGTACKNVTTYTGQEFAIAKVLLLRNVPMILRKDKSFDITYFLLLRSVKGQPGTWERTVSFDLKRSPSHYDKLDYTELYDKAMQSKAWTIRRVTLV